MRIGLWSRDPDQDLYLGNYTSCCIRIDSEPAAAGTPARTDKASTAFR